MLFRSLDIAGYNGNQISANVGLTPTRVSIIRNSPLYLQERQRRWEELQEQVIGKKTDKIVAGDPVENEIKDLALKAVGVHKMIMESGRGEMAKIASANSILDRAGYKARTDKTILSVEVTEKMADRFEKVLKRTTITKED